MKKFFLAFILIFIVANNLLAEEVIKLPKPEITGGMSLTEALQLRRSTREFSGEILTSQELSNLLWATAGVNRPDNNLRVYPVTMGIQDVFVFVFDSKGVYKYNALDHSLILLKSGDHRAKTGIQEFVKSASVNLAYVQDASLWKIKNAPENLIAQWGYAHIGALMQNAYLYAASQGWNAVVRGSFERDELKKFLELPEDQDIKLIHSIGKN